jgi:short-subunit dehydrogenase
LGRALAALLAKKGAHVTIVARDPGRLEAAEKELKVRPSGLGAGLG